MPQVQENGGTGYLFDADANLLQTFSSPQNTDGDFGTSISAVGNQVLIGAPLQKANDVWTGTAYLFGADGDLLHTFLHPDPVVGGVSALLTNHLHHHPLGPSPVEFAVEDLFPGAEVEFAFGDGNDDLPAHDLAFVMGVGVVFAGAIVGVTLGRGVEGGQLFQPLFVVLVQARLVVVDEDAGGDVHRVGHAPHIVAPRLCCGASCNPAHKPLGSIEALGLFSCPL